MATRGIWTELYSDTCQRPRSFGAESRWNSKISVGTGPSNSHPLGTVEVTRIQRNNGNWSCAIWLDGQIVKRKVFDSTWNEIESEERVPA